MKLELHLIPQNAFSQNLRKKMGNAWTSLSKNIRAKRDHTCELCGWGETGFGKYTHLHEIWSFSGNVQKLIGFECVCPTCHAVHHWGFSETQGMDMDSLLKHACKVNDCSEEEFTKHIFESFAEWRKRSQMSWDIDLSYLETLGIRI